MQADELKKTQDKAVKDALRQLTFSIIDNSTMDTLVDMRRHCEEQKEELQVAMDDAMELLDRVNARMNKLAYMEELTSTKGT